MMKSIIYAAAALLVLQLGLAVAVHVKNTSNLESTAPDAPFLSFNPDGITTVVISGPKNKELILKKNVKGWIMPGLFSAPASKNQVENLLKKLAETRQGLAVATSKGAAERFKTAEDEFERHVVLKQGDSVAVDFYLGTSAGFRNSHARIADQNAVVNIPVVSHEVDVDADGWLDRTLADLNKSDLTAVVLGDISLTQKEKDKDKVWLLDGASAEETEKKEVDKLLNKVTGISVQSVLDPEKSASLFEKDPALQFTVTGKDDKKVTYAFAKQDEHYVLKMSDNALYFKVGKWKVEGLTEMKREKLLVGYEEKKEETTAVQEAPQPDALDVPDQKAEQSIPQELPAEKRETSVQEEPKPDAVQHSESAEQIPTREPVSEDTPEQAAEQTRVQTEPGQEQVPAAMPESPAQEASKADASTQGQVQKNKQESPVDDSAKQETAPPEEAVSE